MTDVSVGETNQPGDVPGEVFCLVPSATEHIIDCNAKPMVLDRWKILDHKENGLFEWDPSQIFLWRSKGQEGNKWIGGIQLENELKDKPAENARVLDFLLAHSYLIPSEWKSFYPFFPGTKYLDPLGKPCYRYLYCIDDTWYWGYQDVDSDFDYSRPIVMRVDNQISENIVRPKVQLQRRA